MRADRAKQGCCTYQHMYDLGMAEGLVGKLVEFTCEDIAPAGEYNSRGYGKTRPGQVAALISMCVSQVWWQAELGKDTASDGTCESQNKM